MRSYQSLTPLPAKFYVASPKTVAPSLLGKVILRELDGVLLAGRVVETEAYLGLEDPAAHCFNGKTARNAVLFGPPGHVYVYFIYGMYSCLNFSCEPEGSGAGVLIRALEPLAGVDLMERLRGNPRLELLTSGPGRLCQAMGITRALLNGVDASKRRSPLRVVDDGFMPGEIGTRVRVGIRQAADLPLRFVLVGNKHLSRP